MSEEVRANGLNVTLSGGRKGANSLEVLLLTPARRQRGEGNVNSLRRSHWGDVVVKFSVDVGFFCSFFSAGANRQW